MTHKTTTGSANESLVFDLYPNDCDTENCDDDYLPDMGCPLARTCEKSNCITKLSAQEYAGIISKLTGQKIWMRLGISLNLPYELMSRLLAGDNDALKEAIKKGMWELYGESYIPNEVMEELGLSCCDVNFQI